MIINRRACHADRHYAVVPSPAFFLREFGVADPLDGLTAGKRLNLISNLQFLHWTVTRGSQNLCPLQQTAYARFGFDCCGSDLRYGFFSQRKERNACNACSHCSEQLLTRADLPKFLHDGLLLAILLTPYIPERQCQGRYRHLGTYPQS